jgi:hypothetical protein
VKRSIKESVPILRQVKDAIRTGYAWPGGYPLSVICNDGGALCTECARKEWGNIAHDTVKGWRTGWDVVGAEILWEGGNHCDQCSANLDACPQEEGGEA